MSTTIRVQRICELCGKPFEAKTTVTRFCSDYCSKRGYKLRKRQENIEASNAETRTAILRPITEIQQKDFLSVEDVCILFGVSRTTIWRLSKSGRLKSVKIGKKRFIKRAALDRLFE